jgi:hypothetical protein
MVRRVGGYRANLASDSHREWKQTGNLQKVTAVESF